MSSGPRRSAKSIDGRKSRQGSCGRPTVVMMVRTPQVGRVKTRLARGVGAVEAWRFYRSAMAAIVRRLAGDSRWRLVLAITPGRDVGARCWPTGGRCTGVLRVAQGGGDLGQRMQRQIDRQPGGPVLVVGSDIPGITAARVARAVRQIGGADVVLGPAPDGGYWLVGARRRPRVPRLFAGVRWSHAETMSDTLANARGLTVRFADSLDDVDEAVDLTRHSRGRGRIVFPPIPEQ